eukprot:SAG22_NODE_37_length_26837_cov_8.103523_11_plen_298_part_00
MQAQPRRAPGHHCNGTGACTGRTSRPSRDPRGTPFKEPPPAVLPSPPRAAAARPSRARTKLPGPRGQKGAGAAQHAKQGRERTASSCRPCAPWKASCSFRRTWSAPRKWRGGLTCQAASSMGQPLWPGPPPTPSSRVYTVPRTRCVLVRLPPREGRLHLELGSVLESREESCGLRDAPPCPAAVVSTASCRPDRSTFTSPTTTRPKWCDADPPPPARVFARCTCFLPAAPRARRTAAAARVGHRATTCRRPVAPPGCPALSEELAGPAAAVAGACGQLPELVRRARSCAAAAARRAR